MHIERRPSHQRHCLYQEVCHSRSTATQLARSASQLPSQALNAGCRFSITRTNLWLVLLSVREAGSCHTQTPPSAGFPSKPTKAWSLAHTRRFAAHCTTRVLPLIATCSNGSRSLGLVADCNLPVQGGLLLADADNMACLPMLATYCAAQCP